MSRETLALAGRLAAAGEPFVLATVVWRQGPSSGKEGAKAVIRPDGSVRGWLGGACAEPTVVREALRALEDGRPRLLVLGPAEDARSARPGVVRAPMACESEGAMEVHLEPNLPPPHVVVVGRSPAVRTLSGMAPVLGWRVTVVDDGGDPGEYPAADEVLTTLDTGAVDVDERTCVVVATQGHYDEAALEAWLATPAGYVALVASRKRADGVIEHLRSRGLPDEALARVHAPAGLDLGRVEPEEIGVAVLAELVAVRAAGGVRRGVPVAAPQTVVDPVCGMTVDVASSHHRLDHEGATYHFCAAGCLRAFESNPDDYLAGG